MENLFDYIADRILETPLMEKAMSRQNFVQKIINLSDNIISHWAMIILLPDHSARNHWKIELLSWVMSIQRHAIKGNQSKEKIIKSTLNELDLDETFYDIIKYKLKIEKVEIKNLESKIKLNDFIDFILDVKHYMENVEKL